MQIDSLLKKYRNKVVFPLGDSYIESQDNEELIKIINSLIKLSKLNMQYVHHIEAINKKLGEKIIELGGEDAMS